MSTAEGDEQDLTRKQRREQAREQRKALEQAQAAAAVRRTRLIQLGIVGGLVVAIVVAILLATGGGKKHKIETGGSSSPVVTEVSGLLNGIPQNGAVLGSPSAPVTLEYFGDLECPICREFTEGALKPLIETEVRPGKLRIEYRSLQTATPEPETFKTQQVAALAAGEQQKAWYYIELFYHQQGEEKSGYVTESYLQGIAKQVPGLNLSTWAADRSNPELSSKVTTDEQAANSYGFTGTPSFAIGKTGGSAKKFEPASYTDPSAFESEVERLAKS